jgi:hypothetical protein
MNWRRYGRQWSWCNSRYYPGLCLEGLTEFTKSCQDSWSLGQDLNVGPPNFKARMLLTWLLIFCAALQCFEWNRQRIELYATIIPHNFNLLHKCQTKHIFGTGNILTIAINNPLALENSLHNISVYRACIVCICWHYNVSYLRPENIPIYKTYWNT